MLVRYTPARRYALLRRRRSRGFQLELPLDAEARRPSAEMEHCLAQLRHTETIANRFSMNSIEALDDEGSIESRIADDDATSHRNPAAHVGCEGNHAIGCRPTRAEAALPLPSKPPDKLYVFPAFIQT